MHNRQYIAQLPIRMINFSDPKEKRQHDDLVKLVDVMLDLRKREQEVARHELERLKRQIDKTDREIDDRVFDLYGVTEKEKAVICKVPT